jgi:hypothetical protein
MEQGPCWEASSGLPSAVFSHLHTLVPGSILKMEAIRSYETSVYTRSTRRHIPEDGILHSHCRENLRSYIIVVYLVSRFLAFCVTRKLITLFRRTLSWDPILSQINPKSHPHHIYCWTSSSCLRLIPWNDLLPLRLSDQKFCVHIRLLRCMLHAPPVSNIESVCNIL